LSGMATFYCCYAHREEELFPETSADVPMPKVKPPATYGNMPIYYTIGPQFNTNDKEPEPEPDPLPRRKRRFDWSE
jgi:hypothetical protein